MENPIYILGLESSCDDTAVAILRADPQGDVEIVAQQIETQSTQHARFGGVVPEISARAHVQHLDRLTRLVLAEAGLKPVDLDALAVTSGPGLIGGLMSAVMYAKGLAFSAGVDLIGVNHLAGHALTPRLTDQVPYPYLMLLVSGGHCQFLIVNGPDAFTRLGSTIDDAPGEAFDKVARLLGLEQPGGPAVEKWAQDGDAKRFTFPRPLLDRTDCNLSFSGLKTAVLRGRDEVLRPDHSLLAQDVADICAGFQAAVSDVLTQKTKRALAQYAALEPEVSSFCIAGGVAANQELRHRLTALCAEQGVAFFSPPLRLCTDNAAMIAYAGYELWLAGQRDEFDLAARPRWPLDETQAALIGYGKKGVKA